MRTDEERASDDLPPSPAPSRRPSSFGATVKAVFWSFFGVRKRSDYEQDAASLNPVHVLIAGVIGALLFIGVLIVIVRLVVSK